MGRGEGRLARRRESPRLQRQRHDLGRHRGREEADVVDVGGTTARNVDSLGATLDAKTQGKKDTTIFFQADKGVDYGDLMSVMDALRGAGYLKVGLVGLETAPKK